MRQHFHDELAGLERQTVDGLDLVRSALVGALEALAAHDLERASLIVMEDDRIDGRYLEVHQGLLSLLARQAPVATDLRLVTALLHVIGHIERMGDQCVNIAKLIWLSSYRPPDQGSLVVSIQRMGELALAEAAEAKRVFTRRDVEGARGLADANAALERANDDIFRLALKVGADRDSRAWAMGMILAARALERIGNNAVDIGEQAGFVLTGDLYETVA